LVTNYERGRNFEYRVKRFFEKLGYFVVRSAGSHSPCDLVCIKPDLSSFCSCVRLVQCKYGESKMSKKEEKKFREFCDELFASGYIAVTDKNGHIRFRYMQDITDDEAEIYARQVEE